MFTTNYYCLVAGLKEYSLDADTKGFDAKAIVGDTCSSDTILRAIKELTQGNIS